MTLVWSAEQVAALRAHLLQEDGQERFAFVYCSESGDDLLVADIVPVADADLGTQSQAGCRPRLAVERDLIQACRRRDLHPLVCHSHPFSQQPAFSRRDRDLMDGYRNWLTPLYPDMRLAFAAVGTEGIETAVYDTDSDSFTELSVRVVGDWRLEPPLSTTEQPAAEAVDTRRFDRSIRAITDEGQHRLAAAHVGIVGVGGLGSIMAEELALYGVNRFTLIDPDHVERSNLPRLFGATDHHVGRPKVDVMRDHLWRVNPEAEATPVQAMAENAENALHRCDVLVAGVDRVSTRSFLNEFAVRHLKYYLDAGVVIGTDDETVESMEGFIQLVAPGANACYDCLDRGDPEWARIEQLSDAELNEEIEQGYIDGSELAPEPAVVPLNGLIASKAVTVVAELVTGYAPPEDFLRFEGLDNELVELTTHRNDACVTCGQDGMLGRGDSDITMDAVEPGDSDLDLALGPAGPAADGDNSAARHHGKSGVHRRLTGLMHRAVQLPQALTPSGNDSERGR